MRMLDLFCGAGGAAVGYYRAGITDIVGVDHQPQPHYPFTFVHDDALAYLSAHGGDFDIIHASPPCQAYATMANRWRATTLERPPALVGEVRDRLQPFPGRYVIENVPGAPLVGPILLHGGMFGLGVYRPRLFECSPSVLPPPKAPRPTAPKAVYGRMDGRLLWRRKDGTEYRACTNLQEAQEAMGIDWMTWDELREAIPPLYTKWIGEQWLGKS